MTTTHRFSNATLLAVIAAEHAGRPKQCTPPRTPEDPAEREQARMLDAEITHEPSRLKKAIDAANASLKTIKSNLDQSADKLKACTAALSKLEQCWRNGSPPAPGDYRISNWIKSQSAMHINDYVSKVNNTSMFARWNGQYWSEPYISTTPTAERDKRAGTPGNISADAATWWFDDGVYGHYCWQTANTTPRWRNDKPITPGDYKSVTTSPHTDIDGLGRFLADNPKWATQRRWMGTAWSEAWHADNSEFSKVCLRATPGTYPEDTFQVWWFDTGIAQPLTPHDSSEAACKPRWHKGEPPAVGDYPCAINTCFGYTEEEMNQCMNTTTHVNWPIRRHWNGTCWSESWRADSDAQADKWSKQPFVRHGCEVWWLG